MVQTILNQFHAKYISKISYLWLMLLIISGSPFRLVYWSRTKKGKTKKFS